MLTRDRRPGVRRRLGLLAGVVALVAALVPVGGVVAAAAEPKVVLIVGPAGAATDRYLDLAEEAAAAAARHTRNVVRVYTPDATWPAVTKALAGASVVVYLGHGNGWPSPYRSSLTGTTQNGLGLNPHAGAGDVHQYFGEDRIAAEVRLARNAVVILSHLCYASGNAEPGMAEGTLDVGQQRVDNYAAGFIRAGAAAVIAEAHMGPAYYVDAILAGRTTVDRIWQGAPTANRHVIAFESARSPGYLAQMDPDEPEAGFYRSLVARPGLAAAQVVAGATGGGGGLAPFERTLAGLGISFSAPALAAPPTAGSTTTLDLPLRAVDPDLLPSRLMLGTRWDLLDASEPGPPPAPTPSPSPPSAPGGSPGPSSGPLPAPAGPDLVVPERPGALVAPAAVERTAGGLRVPVRIPSTPGLYRLVVTVHDADAIAFDAASQALLPALVVRVTGAATAAYAAPADAFADAGEELRLAVAVTNLGSRPWGHPAVLHSIGQAETEPASRAVLIARWVDLGRPVEGPDAASAGSGSVVLPAGLAPGETATALLLLIAPSAAGSYLVVIDVAVPRLGSLAARGVPPGIVRVTVGD